MTDRSTYLELIRELVKGDPEAYRQRCEELDEKGWDELGLVVGAAFFLAVRERQSELASTPDIIRYVADTRAEIAETGFDLVPAVAEALIRSATTGDTAALEDVDANLIIESEMLLLWKLLGAFSDEKLSRFLVEVDALSERWAKA